MHAFGVPLHLAGRVSVLVALAELAVALMLLPMPDQWGQSIRSVGLAGLIVGGMLAGVFATLGFRTASSAQPRPTRRKARPLSVALARLEGRTLTLALSRHSPRRRVAA
jgi:hypothetical protein